MGSCIFKHISIRYLAGLHENIFHGQAPGLRLLKMDKPWFFSDKLPCVFIVIR